MELNHIEYRKLNPKQKERYNFQKIAGILADYGFSSIKLDDDWQSADFIAQHIDGSTFLKVQLKGRLEFNKKYRGKNIHIAFPHANKWYLLNHDEGLVIFLDVFREGMATTSSWVDNGHYTWGKPSKQILNMLALYELTAAPYVALVSTGRKKATPNTATIL
jgi:hypothetical protein